MSTNVEIDDHLMQEALDVSGLPTNEAVVEEALRLMIQLGAQRRLLEMAGNVEFVAGYDPEQGDDEHHEW
jgi:Arc/MetJ family transcription regulator